MNVVLSASYRSYAWLFERANLMVFNYLISENKIRLVQFADALSEMVQRTNGGCYFVVVDRLERQTSFRKDVTDILGGAELKICGEYEIEGVMSDDETALGDYPDRFKSRPRRWFRTRTNQYPTVFAVVAQKQ